MVNKFQCLCDADYICSTIHRLEAWVKLHTPQELLKLPQYTPSDSSKLQESAIDDHLAGQYIYIGLIIQLTVDYLIYQLFLSLSLSLTLSLYIYIYMCVCVCVWLGSSLSFKYVWFINKDSFCLYIF